jgi:hypothetical protein
MARKIEVIITGDAASLERALGRASKQATGFQKGLRSASIGAGVALAALGVAAKVGFSEFADAERVGAQTSAALKSTGNAANITKGQIESLADSLMRKSGVDDEVIQSGENMLLTFTRVRNEVGKGNDIFNQATTAALNVSVALGKDMSSSAMLVGKALNDPIAGMSALTRAGIQFTDQQKETIKSLIASGDQMGAQKIILKELETQFGGSADAAGKTFGGQVNIARESAKNLAAEIVAGSVPALRGLTVILGSATRFLSEHQTATKVAIAAVAGLALGVLAVNAAVKVYTATQIVARAAVAAWTAAQWLLNAALTANPIGVVIVAVAALAAGIVIAYRRSETFRSVVQSAFGAAKVAILVLLGPLGAVIASLDRIIGVAYAAAAAIRAIPTPNFGGGNISGGDVPITPGSRVPRRAAGGPVSAGTTYMVGERGPELFTSSRSGRIIPNGGTAGGDIVLVLDGEVLGRYMRKNQSRYEFANGTA